MRMLTDNACASQYTMSSPTSLFHNRVVRAAAASRAIPVSGRRVDRIRSTSSRSPGSIQLVANSRRSTSTAWRATRPGAPGRGGAYTASGSVSGFRLFIRRRSCCPSAAAARYRAPVDPAQIRPWVRRYAVVVVTASRSSTCGERRG